MNFGRSVIIAELWWPEVARRWKKFRFFGVIFGKTTPYGKIVKILFWKDSRHWSTCCVQISWNLANGKLVKSCIVYLTKKKQNFAWLSSSRYCVDRAQNLPGPVPDNVLRVLQISSSCVHFQ